MIGTGSTGRGQQPLHAIQPVTNPLKVKVCVFIIHTDESIFPPLFYTAYVCGPGDLCDPKTIL